MPIQLYAEHLLNIRTLSIQASLDTHSNKETKVQLSADGRTLTLLHDGEQASILLPVAVPDSSTSTLTIPVIPSKDLSFRIRLEGTGADAVGDGEIIVPWTAPSLLTDAEVSCKACKATIVGRGSVTVWKDLPSEGWAEMMDFWHCHKPNEPHDHDHDATGMKGYAANSVLTAVSTVGLVNATSFLLAASDCSSLKKAHSEATLDCANCGAPIGVEDGATQSYKLSKRAVALSAESKDVPQSFSDELWLSCQLLTAAHHQGLRKLRASCATTRGRSLLIWLFAPDLTISSCATPTPQPRRVAKVMWKHDNATGSGDLLNQQSLSEGELEVQETELEVLQACLLRSADLMPASARKFQEWNVGLLHRFSSMDLVS